MHIQGSAGSFASFGLSFRGETQTCLQDPLANLVSRSVSCAHPALGLKGVLHLWRSAFAQIKAGKVGGPETLWSSLQFSLSSSL